jgi:CubicO group peptidase (beta-lactamase class C family)
MRSTATATCGLLSLSGFAARSTPRQVLLSGCLEIEQGVKIMTRSNLNSYGLLLVFAFVFNPALIPSSGMAQDKAKPEEKKPIDYPFIITKLKEQLPGLIEQRNIPGMAIAMIDGEKLIWSEGFGYADRSNKIPVTADTLFNIQSISKTYTVTGFIKAVEKGKVRLDDPLRKYMPKFAVKSRFGADEAGKITFRYLLSHRSGLPHEAPCGNNSDDRLCTFENHIKSISDVWLRFPVGETYSYSNLGIDLAGYVLQLRSGKPFAQFMKEELFTPLGMTSSTFDEMEALKSPNLAKGYDGDKEIAQRPVAIIPSGGLYSTVKDMVKFVSFHLANGKVKGKPIIGESLLKEMYKPQFAIKEQVGGYGLGIAREPWRGGTLLYHGGSSWAGYSATQRWMPEYQVGVVILTNSAQGNTLADAIANRVLQLMIEAKYGSAPETEPIRLTDKPVVAVEVELLRRLEGTYKPRGSVVTFKVQEGSLYHMSGNDKVKLNTHSSTEFTSDVRRFTFYMDNSGKPKGVQVLGLFGVEFFPTNDQPDDKPGPNRQEWQKFTGEYIEKTYEHISKATVSIRNGYLYTSWQGGLKLTEYKPGLFFTADGESVMFQGDRMLFGNRPFLKEKRHQVKSQAAPDNKVLQVSAGSAVLFVYVPGSVDISMQSNQGTDKTGKTSCEFTTPGAAKIAIAFPVRSFQVRTDAALIRIETGNQDEINLT